MCVYVCVCVSLLVCLFLFAIVGVKVFQRLVAGDVIAVQGKKQSLRIQGLWLAPASRVDALWTTCPPYIMGVSKRIPEGYDG